MDYDENDFRSQNLHLADEGSTRFPPVLRQYALPKFDFDDSIQGHVRFDSLVETEVYLGIESNEDNQWIEHFSRENSGVEFRTSGTEDCCILRRKNVWSEATSSESVEMLLKSVGQEDITPPQATTEELNACDKFKQMEPIIEHGNKSFSEMENIMNLGPTSIPDESHEEFLTVMEPSIRHCDSRFSEMESVMNLEPTPLPGEVHESFSTVKRDTSGEIPLNVVALENLDRSLIHVDSPIGCIAGGSPKVERFQISDWNSDLPVQSKADPLVKISLQGNQWEDSCASGNPTDGVASSTHNLTAHSFELNNEQVKPQVRNESSDGSQIGNGKQEDDESGTKKEVQSDDQMASSMKAVEEKVDAGITNDDITNDEKHSNVISNLINESHVGVGQSEIVQSDRFDGKVVWKSGEFGDQSEVSVVPVFSKFNGDTVEVIVSHIGTEIFTSQETEMVSTMSANTVIEGRDGLQLNSDVLISEASSSLSIRENNEVCKGDACSSSPMRESSSLHAVSSAALSEEIHVPAALSGEFDASGVLTDNLKAEDVKAVFIADPILICEDAIHHVQDNVHDLHVSGSEEKGTRLIEESVGSDYLVDGVQSSFYGEPRTEKILVVSRVQCHESERKEPASVTCLDDPSVAMSDSSYDALVSIGDGVLTDINVNHNKDQLSNSEVARAHMDERDEDAVEVSAKESLSSLLDSSQLEARSCPISCVADNTLIIIGEKMLSDRADHLVPQKENCDIEAQSEPEAEVCNEVSKNCTKEMDVFPIPYETVATIGDGLDIMSDLKQIPPNNQMLTQSMAKPSLETEESNRNILKEKEHIQTVSTSEGENNGQVDATITDANSDSETNKESSSRVAFSHSVVQESDDKPTSPDGAKIFSSLDSENKFSKEPSMQALLVSETVDVDAINECSTFQDPKSSSASEIERSLSLAPTPMEDLSNRDSSIDRQSSPAISASKVSPTVDGSLSFSGLGLIGPQDATRESPQASDKDIMGGHHKGSTEPRTRRSSVKGTGKESSKKGNLAKTIKSLKQSERGEKSSNLLTSPGGFQLVQSNKSEHHGHMECNSMQPLVFVTPSTSSLSDLNSSTSPSAMFQQPFTDLQQVELRAQIFVYGALIQGVAPDEACMLSAFGGPDSRRSLWENAWRMCIKRLHGQKSYPTSSETSLQSHSGAKVLDQAMKKMTPQSKVFSSPVSRVSSEGTAAVVNSMIPPSSPLWNISTPAEALQSVGPRGSVTEYQQAASPFLSFQTPPTRNFIGVTTSWLSQAPFRSSWVATSQTATTEVSARLSGLPITEPVHLNPQREPFIPQSSGLKLPGLMVHSSVPTTVFPGPSPLLDRKRTSIIHQNSSDPKPRKRKKIPVAEDQNQVVVQSSPLVEQVSFPTVVHSQSPSASISNSSDFSAKDGSEKLILPVSSRPSTADLKKVDQDVEQRGPISEETLGKVKEARQLAEDASACAAGAVQRGQEIWSQLGRQSNSGLESDIQARISSAAVAIAAAVAVAKAAAAAAKVASNAALQAKLMAEEAFASTGYENSGRSHDATANGIMHSVGKGNSASKLMIEGGTNSSSIIFAAKEAARKRVEATTAASKQAENMDAIVKAAELAAEAVSQAGKIVAMGEPLPLSELVKVVPECCLKVPQLSNEIAIRSDEKQLRLDSFGDCSNSSAKPSKGPYVANESGVTTSRRSPIRGLISKDLIEDQHKIVDFVTDTGIVTEYDLRGKAHKISDLAKTIGVDPESEFEARSTQITNVEVTGLKDNTIKEGSCVEILKDANGLKAAWFTASVLSLKDAEAYVCYNDLQREEGSGPLMEWVPLESQEDQPPKIRISRPVSAKQYEGTRKRRRAALTDHAWSVGDRVDAWVQDSWREGVVSEKNQKDGTTMTIHFPASGETSVVKIWHLRPSVVWTDGKWVEWSINHGRESSFESDAPREKRLKFGSPLVKAKGKDNIPKLANVVEPGLEDSRLLVLSANERALNVGNKGKNENKSYPLRTIRTGLQEGSRVIFGVPKPGKKRKFMEVSKHYVAHHYKATEASDSVNFVKYLMPQGSGPKRLKNPPKPVRRENRETENRAKQAIEMNPKGTSKSGKPPIVSDRTLPPRENYMKNAVATPMDGTDSEIHGENTLGKHNAMERGSFGEALETSLAPFGEAPKKTSSSIPKLERANKGKFAPGEGGKLSKIEEDKVLNSNPTKSTSEIEPRRSVRRIQPTSRLLEGLQSSLTNSKNPTAHEKAKTRLMRPASKAK